MLKIILFILLLPFNFFSQQIVSEETENGMLYLFSIGSAPFPHKERSAGHKYDEKYYSAEEHYSDSSVAVFVPDGFRSENGLNIVLYFHGWWNSIEKSIDEFDLTDQFAASGKNALLILPEGPKNAPDSFGGKLEDEQGFARFLNEVIALLFRNGCIESQKITSIILSGHSGGYRVIAKILEHGGYRNKISEVFLFDGLYAQTDSYLDWVSSPECKRFVNIYTKDGGTFAESQNFLKSLDSLNIPYLSLDEVDTRDKELSANKIIFIYSDLSHSEVISTRSQFLQFLRTSSLPALN